MGQFSCQERSGQVILSQRADKASEMWATTNFPTGIRRFKARMKIGLQSDFHTHPYIFERDRKIGRRRCRVLGHPNADMMGNP